MKNVQAIKAMQLMITKIKALLLDITPVGSRG
jgi:hypothetical protein